MGLEVALGFAEKGIRGARGAGIGGRADPDLALRRIETGRAQVLVEICHQPGDQEMKAATALERGHRIRVATDPAAVVALARAGLNSLPDFVGKLERFL